jgi:predicted peptidase
VLVAASNEALAVLNKTDWNHYVIRPRGEKIEIYINGKKSVDYREPESSVARSGLLAVQIHAGGPMEVQFKDAMIQPLPIPAAGNATQPGFHLRTLKTDKGERKYAIYVPEGYDGSKVFPVILFLHGAGERGEDGVQPAQAGIGPAIFNRPHGVPAIVVFPQARQTWAAGSADSNAAVKALDEVILTYAVDPQRVILTGLSMGGRGSWELAALYPERFAAVVPICGPGKTEQAAKYKSLPVWSFCGDADRDQTVLNMRAMVEAIAHEGAKPKITEYRGVGHVSWDRVYNNPEVIDWMFAQRKP